MKKEIAQDREIIVGETLLLWGEYKSRASQNRDHINDERFKDLLEGKDSILRTEVEHTLFCHDCRKEIHPFPESKGTNLWEIAWSKSAASDKISWPQIVESNNGSYVVTIRESEKQSNNGIVSVAVSDAHREQLEGTMVSVVDGKGRSLLRGKIRNGEAFQKIQDLGSIDLRLLIRPV